MIPRLLELLEGHPVYPQTEKVRIDVLRRFGYFSTESNGHLSEYLPWYPEEVWQMTDNMLIGQAAWLPQYAEAIDGAKSRLAAAEANGTRVSLIETQGAVRVHTKSVAEMAEHKAATRANVAADKTNMTA